MAERTMAEILQAPTEGYGEAIVIPKINADHFEIKTNSLQLFQANPYHGFERENPYTHINNFKRITSTLKFRDVPNDVIRLVMFSYSLEGAARVWYVVPTSRVVVPTGRYVVSTGRVVVPTGRYVVPTGRVVVPTGRYVVFTGRVVVLTGRYVVPTGRVVVLTG
nr:reverse transcriptase domain-containing protein [Tanacetum cinerariifolium]